jgi:hypothetical protein
VDHGKIRFGARVFTVINLDEFFLSVEFGSQCGLDLAMQVCRVKMRRRKKSSCNNHCCRQLCYLLPSSCEITMPILFH